MLVLTVLEPLPHSDASKLVAMTETPRGRLSTKRRSFEQVVKDLRHAVYAVIRNRPTKDGRFQATALGSGFFASKTVFLTCNHVVNGPAAPHVDGDRYLLVNNLGNSVVVHTIHDVRSDESLHLFPESDVALLVATESEQGCFVALDYGYVLEGRDIGVAGYPLPTLMVIEDKLAFPGLIFRVARSVVTARYVTNINSPGLPPMTNIPAIEVNFLFVPGNSGGPIFDAEHGQVIGFVHGFQSFTVAERAVEASLIPDLPEGLGRSYIQNVSGIYSLGIKLDLARDALGRLGVV